MDQSLSADGERERAWGETRQVHTFWCGGCRAAGCLCWCPLPGGGCAWPINIGSDTPYKDQQEH